MTNIIAELSIELDGFKKNEIVKIINVEGMRCTVCNNKGKLGNLRFDELVITDTSLLSGFNAKK